MSAKCSIISLVSLLLTLCFLLSAKPVYSYTLTAGDLAPYGAIDGQLNAADIIILRRFIFGELTPTQNELLAADVAPIGASDGVLNAADLAILTRAVLGEITLAPIVVGPDAPILNAGVTPTNDNPYTLTGSATDGMTVRLYINSQLQAETTATGGVFTFNAALFDGINSIHATTFDGVDESTASNSLSIEYINNIPRTQGGLIAQDTVWTPGSTPTPYVITSNLTVNPGINLTLQPGTTLTFNDGFGLVVDGTLTIQGTMANTVTLTSNGSLSSGAWTGIVINNTSTNTVIEYADIQFVRRGIDVDGVNVTIKNNLIQDYSLNNSGSDWGSAAIYMQNGAGGMIENNMIDNTACSLSSNCYSDVGIYLNNSAPTLSLSGNTIQQTGTAIYADNFSSSSITDNIISNVGTGISTYFSSPTITGNIISDSSTGIFVYLNSDPVINGGNTIINNNAGISLSGDYNSVANNPNPVITANSIYGNGTNIEAFGLAFVSNDSFNEIDITGNWWGSTDTSSISSAIYSYKDSQGDRFTPLMKVVPFLDGPGGNPVAGNFLSGIINTNITLTNAAPYEVVGDAVALSNVVVTVDAGAEIQFSATSLLEAAGELHVNGVLGNEARFTSSKAVKAAGDWNGVRFDGSNSTISYAIMEYMSRGLYGYDENYDEVLDTPATITNSTFHDFTGSAIYIDLYFPATIMNNTITNPTKNGNGISLYAHLALISGNTIQGVNRGIYIVAGGAHNINGNNIITGNNYGIYIPSRNTHGNPNPVVNNNQIYNNSTLNYYVGSGPSTAVDATLNWWGTEVATEILATVSPIVNYSPYLDANGQPVESNILSGVLSGDKTITAAQPVVILGSVIVPAGVTLTIEAGSVLEFPAGTNLTVGGILDVNGLSGNPVTFTSDQAIKAPGQWQGLIIEGAGSVIEYAAVDSAVTAVEVKGTSAIIRNSSLTGFSSRGIYMHYVNVGASRKHAGGTIDGNFIDGGSQGLYIVKASPIITNNIIQNANIGIEARFTFNSTLTGNELRNNNYGIYLSGGFLGNPGSPNFGNNYDPHPIVTGNKIYNNTLYNYYTGPYSVQNEYYALDASNNWWGFEDADLIANSIYDNKDTNNVTSPVVYFSPYTDINLVPIVLMTDIVVPNGRAFNPIQGQSYDINFTLPQPATVSLRIKNTTTQALIREVQQTFSATGPQTMSWDGKDALNNYIQEGLYDVELHVNTGTKAATYSLPDTGNFGVAKFGGSKVYNPYKNELWYWQTTFTQDRTVRIRVAEGCCWRFYVYDYAPFEIGSHLITWDSRNPVTGQLVAGSVLVGIDTSKGRPSTVILRGTKPKIVGFGTAPNIEVKSDPYYIVHSYDQFSQIGYRIDQDAYVTVKLLPPGIDDINDPSAIVITNNELQAALDAGSPKDHIAEWHGYNVADPNLVNIIDEGVYTFVIDATSVQTGFNKVYRGAVQLYQ